MGFWDKVKQVGAKAGETTKIAATKAKLNTDMLLADREINARKQLFGVEMYDHVSPLSQRAEFYAAQDELTTILRGPLINAQREIKAFAGKRVKLKEAQAQAEVTRLSSFPTQAESWQEKVKNAGTSTYLAGGETKIKAEIAIVDRQIRSVKLAFGLELYAVLAQEEDTRGYLPSDRNVRNVYDRCRTDIQAIENKKRTKQQELNELNGVSGSEAPRSDSYQDDSNTDGLNQVPYAAPNSFNHQQQGVHSEPDDLLLL
jgi:hypothetical protein